MSVIYKDGTYYGLSDDMPAELTTAQMDAIKASFDPSGVMPFGSNPVGTVISFYGLTAPAGYLACDGSEYNREDYPQLANHLVTNFSDLVGDGSTTFKVPDLRGEFLRGTGTNSYTSQGNGANVGVHQDATEIPIMGGNDTGMTMLSKDRASDISGLYANKDKTVGSSSIIKWVTSGGIVNNPGAPYGFTARPTNTSILWCIKY